MQGKASAPELDGRCVWEPSGSRQMCVGAHSLAASTTVPSLGPKQFHHACTLLMHRAFDLFGALCLDFWLSFKDSFSYLTGLIFVVAVQVRNPAQLRNPKLISPNPHHAGPTMEWGVAFLPGSIGARQSFLVITATS